MKRSWQLMMLLSFAMAIAPAFAIGPVDGEVGAVWWANDTDAKNGASASDQGGAPGLRAELWLRERYGVRAGMYSSETETFDSTDYTTVDVMWRALNLAEQNFLGVGLGWHDMGLDSVGADGNTSGMRVSAEGRIGLAGMVSAYGQGAWLPSLSDTNAGPSTSGQFSDLAGFEYEMGVAWQPAPMVVVRAGWRANSVDFTHTPDPVAPSPGPGSSPGLTVQSGADGSILIPRFGPGRGSSFLPAATVVPGNTTPTSGSVDTGGFFVGVGMRF